MKKTILLGLLSLGATLATPSAEARFRDSRALYECEVSNNLGDVFYGESSNRNRALHKAMKDCQRNTPFGFICFYPNAHLDCERVD